MNELNERAVIGADPGALVLLPPDGYQYGDDHPWTGEDQSRLVRRLEKLLASLRASST